MSSSDSPMDASRLREFAHAQAGVHQDARIFGGHQRGVPGTAAGQHAEFDDVLPPTSRIHRIRQNRMGWMFGVDRRPDSVRGSLLFMKAARIHQHGGPDVLVVRRRPGAADQSQPDPGARSRLRPESSRSVRARRHSRHEVPHAAHPGQRYRGRSGGGRRTVRACQAGLARAALARTELPSVRAVPARATTISAAGSPCSATPSTAAIPNCSPRPSTRHPDSRRPELSKRPPPRRWCFSPRGTC